VARLADPQLDALVGHALARAPGSGAGTAAGARRSVLHRRASPL
jgi:hypothetical protein